MPTLSALLDHLGPLLTDRAKAEKAIREQFGGLRVYVPPPGSPKDGTKAARIKELSKRLPVKVVAERAGCSRAKRIKELSKRLPVSTVAERLSVSRQYVYQVIRRPKR